MRPTSTPGGFEAPTSALVGVLCAAAIGWSAAAGAQGAHRRHGKPHPSHAAKHHASRGHAVQGVVESRAATSARTSSGEPPAEMTTRGPTRLDFDDRVVQGQSNKAGAVFLYDRKNLPLRSMVRTPIGFRDRIAAELPVEGER